MSHWKTYMPRSQGTVCAADVEADRVVKIGAVKQRQLLKKDKKTKESKPNIMLHNSSDKPAFVDADGNGLWWVGNKTNFEILEELFGDGEIENWVGRCITIYQTTCKGEGGQQVACIRVRPKLPPQDKGPVKRTTPASNTKPAEKPAAKPTAPAASQPPIDTQNDASQTWVPPEPPDAEPTNA